MLLFRFLYNDNETALLYLNVYFKNKHPTASLYLQATLVSKT